MKKVTDALDAMSSAAKSLDLLGLQQDVAYFSDQIKRHQMSIAELKKLCFKDLVKAEIDAVQTFNRKEAGKSVAASMISIMSANKIISSAEELDTLVKAEA